MPRYIKHKMAFYIDFDQSMSFSVCNMKKEKVLRRFLNKMITTLNMKRDVIMDNKGNKLG